MLIPSELASACADVAAAGPADTIAGRAARYVAAPASTEEASALLRAAATLGLTVVPRGAGLLQHWGNPPDSCNLIIDTRRLDRVVKHSAGDPTVTVQAGVRLPDLAKVLEADRHSLMIRRRGRAYPSTVGGLIATNAAGYTRYRYGTPRDLLTGITAVRADGTIVSSGGAGPTVAGQDLVTLFAGSYGTLGLITEATLRLHPLPHASGRGVPAVRRSRRRGAARRDHRGGLLDGGVRDRRTLGSWQADGADRVDPRRPGGLGGTARAAARPGGPPRRAAARPGPGAAARRPRSRRAPGGCRAAPAGRG